MYGQRHHDGSSSGIKQAPTYGARVQHTLTRTRKFLTGDNAERACVFCLEDLADVEVDNFVERVLDDLDGVFVSDPEAVFEACLNI